MKTSAYLCAFALYLFCMCTQAQIIPSASSTGTEILMAKDTVADITSFSGKYNSGNVFLAWAITNLKNDGIFLVYRSNDGKKFDLIGTKLATGVPIENEIAYYFTDKTFSSGTNIYRVIYISQTLGFLSTEKMIVDTEKEKSDVALK